MSFSRENFRTGAPVKTNCRATCAAATSVAAASGAAVGDDRIVAAAGDDRLDAGAGDDNAFAGGGDAADTCWPPRASLCSIA